MNQNPSTIRFIVKENLGRGAVKELYQKLTALGFEHDQILSMILKESKESIRVNKEHAYLLIWGGILLAGVAGLFWIGNIVSLVSGNGGLVGWLSMIVPLFIVSSGAGLISKGTRSRNASKRVQEFVKLVQSSKK
jgi:hypothetical protein